MKKWLSELLVKIARKLGYQPQVDISYKTYHAIPYYAQIAVDEVVNRGCTSVETLKSMLLQNIISANIYEIKNSMEIQETYEPLHDMKVYRGRLFIFRNNELR